MDHLETVVSTMGLAISWVCSFKAVGRMTPFPSDAARAVWSEIHYFTRCGERPRSSLGIAPMEAKGPLEIRGDPVLFHISVEKVKKSKPKEVGKYW